MADHEEPDGDVLKEPAAMASTKAADSQKNKQDTDKSKEDAIKTIPYILQAFLIC